MYKHVLDSNARLNAQSQGRQMYIDHIAVQVRKIVHESQRMVEKAQVLVKEYYPTSTLGQCLQDFLKEARRQYEQIMCYYKANSNVLNF